MSLPQTLFGAVFLLFLASTSAQTAPGDEDNRCMEQLPSNDENVMMLMNSRHYLQLLHENRAVWDEMDFDNNNAGTSLNPTYVSELA